MSSMGTNPTKFHLIMHGIDKQEVTIPLNINNHEITPESFVKILGVNFDDKLNFSVHISEICKKAARQLNVLKRLSFYLNESCRRSIYTSFVVSTFEYAPVVWFFCGRANGKKLEKLQERALRIIYRDKVSSYDQLLENANVMPLDLIRLKYLAVETFKCIKGYNPKYLNDLFIKKDQNYALRDQDTVIQRRFKTYTFGYNSFSYFGSKVWNNLPTDLKNTSSTDTFKAGIDKWIKSPEARKLLLR